jgi:hypothetical protein
MSPANRLGGTRAAPTASRLYRSKPEAGSREEMTMFKFGSTCLVTGALCAAGGALAAYRNFTKTASGGEF